MAKIYNLKGGQYMYPNEYKLIGTVRGTTVLQPAFGEVLIDGDVIEAETHNVIQKNGTLASKVTIALDGTDTVITPNNVVIEGNLEDELKLLLLFETATTLPSTTFIKVKDTNIPVVNVDAYAIPANTPILFVLFDNQFYAYKSVGGTGGGTTPSTDVLELHNGLFNTNNMECSVEYSVSKLGRVCCISGIIHPAQMHIMSNNFSISLWSYVPSTFAPSSEYPLVSVADAHLGAFTYISAYVSSATPPLQPIRMWITPKGIEIEATQKIPLPLSFSFTYFANEVV